MSRKKRKQSKEIRKGRFIETEPGAFTLKPPAKATANQVNPELSRIAQDAYTEAVKQSWDEENARGERLDKIFQATGKQVAGIATRPQLNPDGSLAQ